MIFVEPGSAYPGILKVLWNNNLPIFPEKVWIIVLIVFMYLARYPCKLQSNHRISLIGCGQGCSNITKFFGNNERLISSEILVFRRVELYWVYYVFWHPCNRNFDRVILVEFGLFYGLLLLEKKPRNNSEEVIQWSCRNILKK